MCRHQGITFTLSLNTEEGVKIALKLEMLSHIIPMCKKTKGLMPLFSYLAKYAFHNLLTHTVL